MSDIIKVSIIIDRTKDIIKISGADKLHYGELKYLEERFKIWKSMR